MFRRGIEWEREVCGEAELREAREEEHVGEPARRDAVQRAAALLDPLVVHVPPVCACDTASAPGGGAARTRCEGHHVSGAEDEHVDWVLDPIGDHAIRRQCIHAFSVRVDEGNVRAVERGQVFIVECRPLAPDGVPRLELCGGFRVLHDLVDTRSDPFSAGQIQTVQLRDMLRNFLRRHYPWRTDDPTVRGHLAPRVGYEIRPVFWLVDQDRVVVDRPGVLPSLSSRDLVPPFVRIGGVLVSHVDAGGCALEDEEFFGPLGKLWNYLNSSGAGANDSHALVLELVHSRRSGRSACDRVVPASSMECCAFEVIETRQGWDLRRDDGPCTKEHELRRH
ncbi:unnamed protein product [Mycena citricolor]|uniref:Uncharacterized protein n=1 Tax=Mycena citricolor TaxID=2018698 RepID=A0AAD2Q2A5_9AGAR|nr:unnamed protein product [Mycena citricolor]